MYNLCRNKPNIVPFGIWSNNHDFRTLHMTINRDTQRLFQKDIKILNF